MRYKLYAAWCTEQVCLSNVFGYGMHTLLKNRSRSHPRTHMHLHMYVHIHTNSYACSHAHLTTHRNPG